MKKKTKFWSKAKEVYKRTGRGFKKFQKSSVGKSLAKAGKGYDWGTSFGHEKLGKSDYQWGIDTFTPAAPRKKIKTKIVYKTRYIRPKRRRYYYD